MGLLSLNNNERPLQEIFIAESARLHGVEGKLYQVNSQVNDIYNDPKVEYLDPVPINILFDDNPKPKLKKLGWLTESDANPYLVIITNYQDKLPTIESITHDTNNISEVMMDRVTVRRYSLVDIPNSRVYDEEGHVSKFLVTEVRGNSVHPLYWECKLVPYRPKIDFNPSTPDTNDRTIDSKVNNTIGRSYISKEI